MWCCLFSDLLQCAVTPNRTEQTWLRLRRTLRGERATPELTFRDFATFPASVNEVKTHIPHLGDTSVQLGQFYLLPYFRGPHSFLLPILLSWLNAVAAFSSPACEVQHVSNMSRHPQFPSYVHSTIEESLQPPAYTRLTFPHRVF